jgi:hypothetical protein
MRKWRAGGLILVLGLATGILTLDVRPAAQSPGAGGDCVTIGTPKPSLTYVDQHSEPRGTVTEIMTIWESVTATGSRGRTTGPQGVIVQVNEHHIADDVAVLDQSTKLDAKDIEIDTTTFRPGLVSDPALRACAGRSWPIPPVTASYKSAQTNASASTPAGTLKIVAIRERVTVPAGTFDTVHYIRTSQSTDEYWKSIEHGVVVKHIATLPMGTVTEVLSAIR